MQVVIRCPPSKAKTSANAVAVQCSAPERRVWVQRGAGPTKQIIFSSTFDSVLSGEVGPKELFATVAEPSVAVAADGKVGCVLCIGPASPEKEASLFAGPFDAAAIDQMPIAARSICEMVRITPCSLDMP